MPVNLEKQKPAIDLSQFSGTEHYHVHSLTRSLYTDGVKYFAEKAEAYWFIDFVLIEYGLLSDKEGFLSIDLIVNDGKADIVVSAISFLKKKPIDYIDCPDGTYKFFLTNRVLMLTGEY